MSQEFRNWKMSQMAALADQAAAKGLNDSTVYALLKKGISRSIDEKYSKKDQKDEVVKQGYSLTLDDLSKVNGGGSGEKADLVAKVVEHGIDSTVAESMKVKQLKEILKAFN